MSNMEKETILYSIINSTDEAYQVIPELKDAWNMTPHRILNLGETIYLNLDNKNNLNLKCLSSESWVNFQISDNKLAITFDSNLTGITRQTRIFINVMSGDTDINLLTFAIYQKG